MQQAEAVLEGLAVLRHFLSSCDASPLPVGASWWPRVQRVGRLPAFWAPKPSTSEYSL